MAKIITYTPMESYEICSRCREKIKIKTMIDSGGEEYKACFYCEEYLVNA